MLQQRRDVYLRITVGRLLSRARKLYEYPDNLYRLYGCSQGQL